MMEDLFMLGSVIFDIFCPDLEQIEDFEEFEKRVQELGAKVEIIQGKGSRRTIRVHNDEEEIPEDVLEYADDWAGRHLFDHAYR